MIILDRAIWLEEKYSDNFYKDLGICEVEYFSKLGYLSIDSREGWFSQLYYSISTGWSQILFYSANPQTEKVILRIDYYPTALEAICDNSIFPPGLTLYMS